MVTGLRERERIRQAFGTYLDHDVAEHILSEGFSEQGESVEVSILFCDVKDFSGFAESAEAHVVVAPAQRALRGGGPRDRRRGRARRQVRRRRPDGGFRRAPAVLRPRRRAVRAAIEIDRRVNREGEGGGFQLGVGVNTGPVLAGSIGGAGRLNFSVIGDAVNVAARVEEATRTTGYDVLITGATQEHLPEEIELEACGERDLGGWSGR